MVKSDRVMDVDGGPVGVVTKVDARRGVRVDWGNGYVHWCRPDELAPACRHEAWEYCVTSADGQLVDKLNVLGAVGWELVAAIHNNLIFKRVRKS